jgi:hypothetical protein
MAFSSFGLSMLLIQFTLRSLKDLFGNTMTTTFYWLVETLDVPAFGLITAHPKKSDKDFDPTKPCRLALLPAAGMIASTGNSDDGTAGRIPTPGSFTNPTERSTRLRPITSFMGRNPSPQKWFIFVNISVPESCHGT